MISNILNTLTFLLILLSSCSLGQNKDSANAAKEPERRKDLEKTVKETSWDRYVLLKGTELADVEEALKIRSEIYLIDWTVTVSEYKDWTLIHFKDAEMEPTHFHGMASWFFGETGEELKMNDSQTGVAIAVNPDRSVSYLTYINKSIMDNARETCDMYGVFQNNEKGIMSACFDMITSAEGYNIPDFNQALENFGINLGEIQKAASEGRVIKIKSKP